MVLAKTTPQDATHRPNENQEKGRRKTIKLTNRHQCSTRTMLLVGVLMAIPVLRVPANAAPVWVGKCTLPYQVNWNHAILPPGGYTITVNSKAASALVRSNNGTTQYYTAVPIIADREKGDTSLLITTAGGQHIVRSLNSPLLGVSFVFQPLSKSEREASAKSGQQESIPVIVTKK